MLDESIKDALNNEVKNMHINDRIKKNIDEKIANQTSINLGEYKMKRFSMKKIVLIGVACFALSATALIAGSSVVSFSSSSSRLTAIKDYHKLKSLEKKLGYKVTVPEQLAFGYNFKDMQIVETKGHDATGTVIEKYPTLRVTYETEAEDRLSLTINQINVGAKRENAVQTLEDEGTTLYYYQDTYKLVPPGYELTEEDKANLERTDYEISYGSSEVEIDKMSSVLWEKEGANYHLLGINTNLSGDEMLQLVKESF